MNIRKFLPISLLAALILGVIALAFPAGSVAAQSPTPQPQNPQVQANRINARLEKLFAAEKRMLNRQAENLDKLDQLVTRVGDMIAKAKANGKDTSALEAALATFKNKQAEANKIHVSAADIIKAHAGFDANGKVIDRAQARETIIGGNKLMRDVRQTITKAARDFRRAVQDWRKVNAPVATK